MFTNHVDPLGEGEVLISSCMKEPAYSALAVDLLINCNSVLFNDLLKSWIFNLEAKVESKMHEIDLIFIMLNLFGAF